MTTVVRTWMAYARAEKAAAYRNHLAAVVLPELRKLSGFLGLDLCEAPRGDRVELLVISRWASMEAVKAFAGSDPDRAVVEPGAKAVLEEYDDFVTHYDVTLEALGT